MATMHLVQSWHAHPCRIRNKTSRSVEPQSWAESASAHAAAMGSFRSAMCKPKTPKLVGTNNEKPGCLVHDATVLAGFLLQMPTGTYATVPTPAPSYGRRERRPCQATKFVGEKQRPRQASYNCNAVTFAN